MSSNVTKFPRDSVWFKQIQWYKITFKNKWFTILKNNATITSMKMVAFGKRTTFGGAPN